MDLSSALIKIIFLFNLVLLGLGVFIIYQGFKNNSVRYDGEKMEDLEKLIGCMSYRIFIIAGIVITVISFFGCFGAFFESPSCLSWYIFLIFLLIVFQVSLGYYIYQTKGLPKDEVKGIFGGAMKKYKTHAPYKSFVDNAQSWLQCCGAQGPREWMAIGMKNPPRSCCADNKEPCESDKWFKKNCVDAFDDWISDIQKNYIFYISVVIGFQVILIIFSCYARGHIKERQSYAF